MALKALVAKLEDVAEAQRAFYVKQDDGSYRLDAEGVEDVSGLKSALAKERQEAKQAREKLTAWDGVDPAEFKRLKAAAEEADRKKAAAEGDFKALEKQLIDRHQAELGGRDTKIGKLTKALEKRLVQAQLTTALTEANAKPTMLKLLVLEGARSIRVRETDEDFEEFVADDKGNPLVADGKGTPMTVKAFVEQTLKTQYPDAFQGTGSSGGGASRSTGGAGGKRVVQRSEIAQYAKEIAAGEVEVATA